MAALDAAIFFWVFQKMPVANTGMKRFVECELR